MAESKSPKPKRPPLPPEEVKRLKLEKRRKGQWPRTETKSS